MSKESEAAKRQEAQAQIDREAAARRNEEPGRFIKDPLPLDPGKRKAQEEQDTRDEEVRHAKGTPAQTSALDAIKAEVGNLRTCIGQPLTVEAINRLTSCVNSLDAVVAGAPVNEREPKFYTQNPERGQVERDASARAGAPIGERNPNQERDAQAFPPNLSEAEKRRRAGL